MNKKKTRHPVPLEKEMEIGSGDIFGDIFVSNILGKSHLKICPVRGFWGVEKMLNLDTMCGSPILAVLFEKFNQVVSEERIFKLNPIDGSPILKLYEVVEICSRNFQKKNHFGFNKFGFQRG